MKTFAAALIAATTIAAPTLAQTGTMPMTDPGTIPKRSAVWAALIVLTTEANPMSLDTGNRPASVAVEASPNGFVEHPTDPAFKMDVKPQEGMHVDRITGVQADVSVNVPTSTMLQFVSEALCNAAAAKIGKTVGIRSVVCVQQQ